MVDKVAENTEHHMRCRKAVFELPFDDLIALYIREHKFIFPETLESIFKKEAKMSAELPDAGDILCKHLPGVTLKIGTDKVKTVSVVPLKYVDSQSNALVESAKFHLAEGILRHEAGQQLGEYYKWHLVKQFFDSDKASLVELFKKLATNQLEPFEVAFAEKAFESLSRNNLKNSVGFEQTLADLYAITYGGSRCVELDDILERSFPTLTEYMKEQNWLRNRFEDK